MVGVLGERWRTLAGFEAEVWPILQLETPTRRGPFGLRTVGRLAPDATLETVRNDLDEVSRVLQQDEPVGRRLDFLMQELNREANTLGSKSADSETTAISVEMKVLVEQMREQVQNIE